MRRAHSVTHSYGKCKPIAGFSFFPFLSHPTIPPHYPTLLSHPTIPPEHPDLPTHPTVVPHYPTLLSHPTILPYLCISTIMFATPYPTIPPSYPTQLSHLLIPPYLYPLSCSPPSLPHYPTFLSHLLIPPHYPTLYETFRTTYCTLFFCHATRYPSLYPFLFLTGLVHVTYVQVH